MGSSEPIPSATRQRRASGNVFLVGLMGAGKTSVGKLLAKRLGKAFCDCDQEIESATGVKIPVIFEIEGETGFRARETKMLAELVARSDIVLATGGGAVLSAENRALLSGNGIVVYLRAAASDLWQRTRHDKNRPLLRTGEPLARLEQLHAERDPLYSSLADVIVDSGSQSVTSLVQRVEQQLDRHASAGRGEGPRRMAGSGGKPSC
ncbi:MAG TPA: shikimate kinase [Burkholderiales bacterium]|nr:shikimate kinase [Burkholderiales bacterium]